MFASDDVTASLMREATAAKNAGKWDRAVACLQEAKARMLVSEVRYPIDQWLRLPLFLQQAGRFAEALSEFDWLIARVQTHDPVLIDGGGPYFRQRLEAICLAHIHDKMRIALKREKRMAEAAEHESLCDGYSSQADRLEQKVNQEQEAEREAYAKKFEAKFGRRP